MPKITFFHIVGNWYHKNSYCGLIHCHYSKYLVHIRLFNSQKQLNVVNTVIMPVVQIKEISWLNFREQLMTKLESECSTKMILPFGNEYQKAFGGYSADLLSML